MARPPKRKLSKKEQKAATKEAVFNEANSLNEEMLSDSYEKVGIKKRKVFLPAVISVKDFADKSNLPVTKIIGELMKNGILANINETVDFETAAIIGDDLGIEIVQAKDEEVTTSGQGVQAKNGGKIKEIKEVTSGDQKKLIPRPPVVTVMGHVDHGKTTLLDNIRKAHVVDTESGGITQHISAYQVTIPSSKDKQIKHRTITFIDTPGHAAFSAMREHGAVITDIVVLIISAGDGVMPQTKEVIEQAKANNVPVIVAINKIDLPDADIMKTKQQLSEFELIPEEWGGKTVMVEISAKTGKGVDQLLEMISLQADMMDLKANPDEKAVGVVIESHMQKGAGAMALVLIENGTLHKCDPVAIGGSYGKVRILQDYTNKSIEDALPSFPVKIAGLKSVPNFGDKLMAFSTEKEARDTAQKQQSLSATINIATAKKIEHTDQDNERKAIEFNIIIKCDVNGSLDALKKMISEINPEEIKIKIISEGVGAIAESDVTLAKATRSLVLGFRVKVLGAAKKIAESENISIKTFDIIYQLIDYLKENLSTLLPPEIIEEELGKGEILAIFRDDKKGFVVGGRVTSGKISMGDSVKILQNDNEKYRAEILSLRKEKSEAREVESGTECGFGLPAGANVAVGDTFVAFKIISKKREIK